ncbi:hypothetical protein LOD99_1305 [Oopsacas minuta]|uniref:FHA domain-containing protein n=1 Tax=Oopsacas minuta TaxID=111878 RepID=A0AAV7K7N8_9METZ|nr:hypothetical protein LOD99_1305 [Oopsacas minuta]
MRLPTLQSPYILNYSTQGEMRFSGSVRSVLESYVISRGILTGILFKCGGTLLYSDEVAHLVVVCCREDPIVEFLPDLPSNSPFTPNHLLFSDHEASGSHATIQINYLKKTGKEGIWDHTLLAFYLPEGQGIVLESGQYQCGITVHSSCSVRPMECPEASNDPFKSISKSRNLGKVIKIITDEADRKKLKKW